MKISVFVKVNNKGYRATREGNSVTIEEKTPTMWSRLGRGRWTRLNKIDGIVAHNEILCAIEDALKNVSSGKYSGSH